MAENGFFNDFPLLARQYSDNYSLISVMCAAVCILCESIDLDLKLNFEFILDMIFGIIIIEVEFQEKEALLGCVCFLSGKQRVAEHLVETKNLQWVINNIVPGRSEFSMLTYLLQIIKNCLVFTHEVDLKIISMHLLENIEQLLQSQALIGEKSLLMEVCLICFNVLSSSEEVANQLKKTTILRQLLELLVT